MKGETQMTRLGTLVARTVVLALLLLTLGGGIANADTTSCADAAAACAGDPSTSSFPDDPGYPQ